ncbi:MAG TPA: hypothetical protein VEW94_12500 [Chloroflexia bacterium]|nr:hypothetical protein [Chloroflexia bacterium]
MAEYSKREHDEHKRVQRAQHQHDQQAGKPDAALDAGPTPSNSGSLLGDARLDGRGNRPVKVAVMRQMQKSYGNRSVQRFLHGASANHTIKQAPQPAQGAAIQRLVIQRSPLSDSVKATWEKTKTKGEIFNLLRAAPQPATSTDTDLTACLSTIFKDQPDDLWLATTIQKYGPEPLWPRDAIIERANRANDPAHPWAREQGNIEATLGTTAGLPADAKKKQPAITPSPVKAYFFPGRTPERALIIGGVHGAEQSGIEVVEALRESLAKATTPPRFTTILVPVLFPDNRAYEQWYRSSAKGRSGKVNSPPTEGGRYSRVSKDGKEVLVEPNRNYPLPGQSLGTAETGGLSKPGKPGVPLEGDFLIPTLLPETRMLLALIERFQPSRIASVHAHRPSTRVGDAPGIFVDPRGGFDRAKATPPAKGKATPTTTPTPTPQDKARTPEGQADDELAKAMLGHARGLRKTGGIPDRDNPGDSVHYSASSPKGTSLGDWAPVAVDEGVKGVQDMPGDRPAITIVTVEVEDYFPSAEDDTGEMTKRVEVHRDTLQNVFLEKP